MPSCPERDERTLDLGKTIRRQPGGKLDASIDDLPVLGDDDDETSSAAKMNQVDLADPRQADRRRNNKRDVVSEMGKHR